MVQLGVNIDHVATLRQARLGVFPEPVRAALIAEKAGASSITVHLREDRRHIQDNDVRLLKDCIPCRLNLEMAVTREMLRFAMSICPSSVCLVPEGRQELTTEGGLNVQAMTSEIREVIQILKQQQVPVSLFIEPDKKSIDAALSVGASIIELHTGLYASAKTEKVQKKELSRLQSAVEYGLSKQLIVNAGHGLHYENVIEIAKIPGLYELNIGHSIVSHAIFVGMEKAVKEMHQLLTSVRL